MLCQRTEKQWLYCKICKRCRCSNSQNSELHLIFLDSKSIGEVDTYLVYDFSWLATAGKTSLGKNESGSMVMIALIAGSKTTTRQKDNIGFPFSFPATQVGPKTSICKHTSLESTYNWIPTKDVCKKKKVGGGFHKSQSEPQMSSPLTRRHKNCDKSPKQIQR